MTYMTKAQLRQHLLNAPPGTSPGGIVASLRKQGVVMEGDPMAETAAQIGQQSLLAKAGGALMKTAEYVASPINAASGLVATGAANMFNKDISQIPDARNLQKNAQMARTSLPLTVGLATAPLSLPAAALATGAAGFTGRGMAETADAVTGQDQQSVLGRVKDAAVEGTVTGVTDLAFGKAFKVAGAVGKKLFSPLAGRFDSEIAALAARKGVKLPVSSMSDSNIVKQVETLSQKGIFGGNIESMVDEASGKLSTMADDLVKGLGGSDDLTIAGKSVIEGADTFRDAWRSAKNKLYKRAREAMDAAPKASVINSSRKLADGTVDLGALKSTEMQPFDLSSTKAVLDELLSSKQAASGVLGDAANSGILGIIRQNIDKPQTIESLTAALDEMNQMTKFGNTLVSTGDQAALKKVIATLDEDVTKGIQSFAPEVAKALRKADNFYSKGITLLDSEFGRKIAKLSDNPTKIVDQLITSNSADDVPRIFELIGKGKNGQKRVADVQSAFASKLFKGASGEDGIMGRTLEKNVRRYGESTVRAVLGEDAFNAMQEITKLAKAVDAGQSVAKGSQTAFTGKAAAFITAVVSGNIPLAASLAGGDAVMSRLFGTEWFRRWITQGYAVPAAAQVGGKVVEQAGRRAAVGASQAILSE